ncbi:MAG: peptide ABC transporter substrate-binding protein [Thermomicrobiales bacterium]
MDDSTRQYLIEHVAGVGRAGKFTRRRLLSLALAAGATGLTGTLLAACGGGGGSLSSGPTATSGATAQTPGATVPAGQTPATGQTPTAGKATEPPVAPGTATPKGQVIVGLSQEPTVFNPLMAHIEVDDGVYFNLFDPLWGVDEKGQYFPMLATEVPSVENGGISADGLIWKVKLHDGVIWHDGQPFSADDVKFTWELIMRDDFKAGSRLGHDLIKTFDVTSPTEVTWTMKEAYAPYIAILASTFIVPKHILGKAADPNTADFNNAPVGTGAFVWSERVAGDHITLTANPKYHGDGPYLEKLVFKYIPDLTVMFTQFKTGEIDHTTIQGITADHYAEASKLADRTIYVGPAPFIENIWFNLAKEQFQDKAVREALYYAMDKDTIIKNIYYGLPGQAESYLPKESWAYNPDLPIHEYNPDKAKEVLETAGWKTGSDGIREKNGVKLAFQNSTTAGNKVREQAQAYLQQNWKDIGVSMEINNMPAAVIWGDYFNQSQYDSVMIGILYGIGPDPDASAYFHSRAIPAKGGSGSNTMQLIDPDLDTLLDEATATVDVSKRTTLYQQIQSRLRENLYFLPIFQYASIEGTKKELIGYVANPNVRSNCWNIPTWRWQA